ncbi:MAG TPA: heme o synthase [bacterium]
MSASPHPSAGGPSCPASRRGLHRYAVFTAACTWLLLIAGGLVTSTDSGLAVPDWPLSYGLWFPPMVGGILYEHGHRMIAAAVGLLILGLAVWLANAEPRRWVRNLGYAALASVVIQALLGGLTVLWLLPPPVSISHALLGQGVFCLVVCVAWATSAGRMSQGELPLTVPVSGLLRPGAAALAASVAAQLLLGAIIRHTGLGFALHAAGAAVVAALAAGVVHALRGVSIPPSLRRHAWRLAALVALQLGLGIAAWLGGRHVGFRTAHVAVGALVLAQAVVLAARVFRETAVLGGRSLGAFVELTKPRLTSLVLVTTGIGYWLGLRSLEALLELPVVVGATALVAGGANALNQWAEREHDARMRRTASRPLPTGRLTPAAAHRFGWALMVSGVAVLAVRANPLAAAVAAASAASYLLVYTPLKRVSPLCTLAGAVPGALPPVIGWAAARGELGLEAWALFLVMFVWQLPHFLGIAVLYREDYARAGFRMLPLMDGGAAATARQTALYGLLLVPVSLFPAVIGLGDTRYALSALALSVAFLAVAVAASLARTIESARLLFRSSILYLPLLFCVLAAAKGGP